MRHFDFTPLYRATVGFDQIVEMMDRVLETDSSRAPYPHYNIEKTADDAYLISIAVAGFSTDDIALEVNEGTLIIAARKARADKQKSYLYKGIASRAFEKQFQLADYVRVVGASHCNGMLHVELKREVPEALKPRHIEISQALPEKTVN